MGHRPNSRPLPPLSKLLDPDLLVQALCAAANTKSLHELEARANRVAKVVARQSVPNRSVKRCSPHHRCRRLGCSVCRYRDQLHLIATYAHVLRRILKRDKRRPRDDLGQLHAITLVPTWGKVSVGGEGVTLPDFTRRLQRLIRLHAPEAKVILCVDLSHNDSTRLAEPVHWQFHAHGVIYGLTRASLARLKRALGGVGRVAHRPIVIEPLYDPVGQLAYMAKSELVLRVNVRRPNGKLGTRIEQPSLSQEAAMSRWLSSYTVDQRTIRIGSLDAVVPQRASAAGVNKERFVKTVT